jgi:hypothetical protein
VKIEWLDSDTRRERMRKRERNEDERREKGD